MSKTRITRILILALVGLALTLGGVGAYAATFGDDDEHTPEQVDAPQGDDDSDDGDSEEGDDDPKPWIGILAGPQEEEDATGLVIRHVVPESPADDAGLEDGDVITEVDGNEVDAIEDVHDAIADKAPGDEVTLTVTRDDGEGDSEDVTVTLGEAPFDKVIKDFDMGGLGDLGALGGLGDIFDGGFDQFLGGTFRYEDDDGNTVAIEVVPGTVTEVADGSITLDVNGNEGHTTFDLGDVAVPEGLADGDDAIVVLKDGDVAAVLPGLGKLGIPGLPGFGPGGFRFNGGDFDPDNLPNLDDFRDWFPDLQPQEEPAAPDA